MPIVIKLRVTTLPEPRPSLIVARSLILILRMCRRASQSNGLELMVTFPCTSTFVPGNGFMEVAIGSNASANSRLLVARSRLRLGHIAWNWGADSFENSVGITMQVLVR